MKIPKLLILLYCSAVCLASHYSHTIPVEGYETELQNLGEHVEIPETPVKVVKITKTIAVKVPVPYPVKVIEKVPYPVHVNKPYPVPVPQIIKVPVAHNNGHEALDAGHENHFQDRQQDGNAYQVQEAPHDIPRHGESYDSRNESYDGGNQENTYGVGGGEHNSEGGYYPQPAQDYSHYGGDQDGHNSFEAKSYDQAIQNYLNNLKTNNFADTRGYQ